jgi:nicotinamidase-related amidase
MSIKPLDPQTALIVIDLQQGIRSYPLALPFDAVLSRACTLAQAFRQQKLPVVLVSVDGAAPGRNQLPPAPPRPAGWSDLVAELQPQPQDLQIRKQTWGAFSGSGLADYLRQQAVTQVVIVGVATSIGVESTARQAHELGFNVALATDAMSDMSLAAHQNSIERIFPRLGETASTQEILSALQARKH